MNKQVVATKEWSPSVDCRELHARSGERSIDAEKLWELTSGISDSAARDVYNFLCEAVSNVIEHAYQRGPWLGWTAVAKIDRERRCAEFEVGDRGIGIAASVRKRDPSMEGACTELIFLTVCHGFRQPGDCGRGLGLSSMAKLASKHDEYAFHLHSHGQTVKFDKTVPDGQVSETPFVSGTVLTLSVPFRENDEADDG